MKKRKIIIIVYLCVFLLNIFSEKISVVSWNINKKDSEKIINTIVKMLKNNSVDILLLQEVSLNLKKTLPVSSYKEREVGDFLDKLKKTLDMKTHKTWEFYSSANYAIRENINEYRYYPKGLDNAVFYRADKLEAKDLYKQFSFNDFLSCQFKTDKNNLQIIQFNIKKTPNFDFYVANLHLPYNNNDGRIRDLQTILNIFSRKLYGKKALIAGDFNTHSIELLDRIKGSDFKIGVTNETTLSKNKYQFSKQYDHFLYNSHISKYIVNQPISLAKLREDKIVLGKYMSLLEFGYDEFRTEISDYVPIFLELYF